MNFDSVVGQPIKSPTKRVLVVEDNVFVAALLKELLRFEGMIVVGPAFSVVQALKLIDESEADVSLSAAVLDYSLVHEVVLPVADRLAALRIPFLFATSHGTACDRGQHAAAPVLEKPYGLEVFSNAVRALTGSEEARH